MIELPKTKCQNPECGLEFRFNPGNSTIKPKFCQRCQAIKDFEKKKQNSLKRIEENRKLLTRAGFYDKSGRNGIKKVQTQRKTKTAVKMAQNGSNWFLIPKSTLQKSADAYFSKYIRLKNSFESNGERICICYTCSTPHKVTNIDNGHWQRRGYYATRFNENNCRPQCRKCNKYEQGKPEIFEKHLIHELGIDEVAKIRELAQTNIDETKEFYHNIIEIYKKKFRELKKELGINPWKK